ncbi:SPFH domain-containing protein [Labrenzia sp. DG1229]|uniref:SPFH domain-containing protein n=1 Tax=Labrenzia sp. DG1229 TaxID=681847 RepID=UPI00048FAE8C|nr:SPFH domain-containing protein [Labrenzia sp. DG1229]
MAQIQRYPFLRHIRADASSQVQQFHKGRRVRSGKGLSFWFLPARTSLSEIPMDDRTLPFLLKGQSRDYQDLTVQGSIIWRVANAEVLGDRIDFTIDLKKGLLLGQPIDQINDLIGSLGRRYISAYVKSNTVRDLLEAGVEPLQLALSNGFAEDDTMAAMGVEIVGVGVDDVSPSSALARALQTPTFEDLQQRADEATFARRALAVEKERAIAENELSTKIELETQRKQLIAREDENARFQAEAQAAALKIDANAEAGRIRTIDQARTDMEKERMAVYADLPPMVMFAMAAQEFAGKLQNIDSLTVTPDMLSNVIGQVQGAMKANPVRDEARS